MRPLQKAYERKWEIWTSKIKRSKKRNISWGGNKSRSMVSSRINIMIRSGTWAYKGSDQDKEHPHWAGLCCVPLSSGRSRHRSLPSLHLPPALALHSLLSRTQLTTSCKQTLDKAYCKLYSLHHTVCSVCQKPNICLLPCHRMISLSWPLRLLWLIDSIKFFHCKSVSSKKSLSWNFKALRWTGC
jgi:hypothetical protein